ncbi:alpha/beta fold hydrolase [Dactylosporangium sp. NPDC048998]|uniref:alpha/beta fold hydrolase n=1 Tax=Dactylosporangium sp. NPDC048998 TaxID=3363976 RepID=UPI003719886A
MATDDLVVVHGGGVTADMYDRLVRALARRLPRITVHVYNRRGRLDAGPKRPGYTVDDEIADLAAVLERTGARNVFGHSYGGLVVMRAALELDLGHVAIYDGTVQVDDLFPSAFVPRMRAHLDAGDLARAVTVMGQALESGGPAAARLPFGVQLAISRAFLRTPIGRKMGELLPTTILETEEVVAHPGPASQYAGIRAPALLACGAQSPPYYGKINAALAAAMPDARTFVLPRSSHNAPNIGRPRFADMLAQFLTGSAVSA